MSPRLRRGAAGVAKAALALGALAWLLRSGRLELAQLAAVGERWPWFLAAQACFGAAQGVAALRWQRLLRSQGIPCPLATAFRLVLLGIFFNQVLLGATGGDMVRAYAIAARSPGRRTGAVMSVVADRALGLLMLLVVAVVAGLLHAGLVLGHPEVASMLAVAAGALLMVCASLALLFSGTVRGAPLVQALKPRLPFREALARVDAALWVYRRSLPDVRAAAALSLGLHALIIAMNLCLALALTPLVPEPAAFVLLVPLALATMAIPLNPPGAVGTGELLYAHLLGLAGFPHGAIVSLLQRVTFVLWSGPAALAAAMTREAPSLTPTEEPAAGADGRSGAGGVGQAGEAS